LGPQARDLRGELAAHLDAVAAGGLLELDAAPLVLARERLERGAQLGVTRARGLLEQPSELGEGERIAGREQRRLEHVSQVGLVHEASSSVEVGGASSPGEASPAGSAAAGAAAAGGAPSSLTRRSVRPGPAPRTWSGA